MEVVEGYTKKEAEGGDMYHQNPFSTGIFGNRLTKSEIVSYMSTQQVKHVIIIFFF